VLTELHDLLDDENLQLEVAEFLDQSFDTDSDGGRNDYDRDEEEVDEDEGDPTVTVPVLVNVFGSSVTNDADFEQESAAQEELPEVTSDTSTGLGSWAAAFIDARSARTEADIPDLIAENIDKVNNFLLHKEGPNGSIAAKRRQLERLSRLDWLYRQGILKRSMLSFYLHHTRELRHKHTLYLSGQSLESVLLPTRLGKLFAGLKMLADRFFFYNSIYYPNLNGVLCPHFLSSRSQFTSGEVQVDIPLCRMRYTSEVGFALFALEEGAADEITYHKFRIVHHIVHWAYANINLHQPLRKPPTYDSFPLLDSTFNIL
jgi:hypothetical protein